MLKSKSRLPKKSIVASRRSKARQVSVPISRSLVTIVPAKLRTKLYYADYFNLASAASAVVVYSFRANSCRDPVAAAGGGSCSGFAQLSALYFRYRVLSVRCEVWGYNTSVVAFDLGIMFRSSTGSALTTGPEAQQTLLERPDLCVQTLVIPYGASTGYPTFRLSSSRTIARIEGNPASDRDYMTTFGTEPNTQCYADVVIVAADGASTTITANANIRLTYTLELSEPNQEYTD